MRTSRYWTMRMSTPIWYLDTIWAMSAAILAKACFQLSVLRRRMMFKNLQKSFPIDTREWLWSEDRIAVLKSILVSLYGTTASIWNRLANVDAFEEINRLSREILIKSKDIVQGLGYELLYADTDSVFLKKSGATFEDFISVKDILARETWLPITLETCYKFLVLLPRGRWEVGDSETLLWYYLY